MNNSRTIYLKSKKSLSGARCLVFLVASAFSLVTFTITACCRTVNLSAPSVNSAILLRIEEKTNSTDFVVVFISSIDDGRRCGWSGVIGPVKSPLADGTPMRIKTSDMVPFELYENYKRVPTDKPLQYTIEDRGSRLDLRCGSRVVRWSYPHYLYNYNNQIKVSMKNMKVRPDGHDFMGTYVCGGWVPVGIDGEVVGEADGGIGGGVR